MHDKFDPLTASLLEDDDRMYFGIECPSTATVCYLVLPTATAKAAPDSWDETMQTPGWNIGLAATVESESLVLSEANKLRFSRAMRQLCLDVHVHPSQLKSTVSAFSPSRGYQSAVQPSEVKVPDLGDEEKALHNQIRKRCHGEENREKSANNANPHLRSGEAKVASTPFAREARCRAWLSDDILSSSHA